MNESAKWRSGRAFERTVSTTPFLPGGSADGRVGKSALVFGHDEREQQPVGFQFTGVDAVVLCEHDALGVEPGRELLLVASPPRRTTKATPTDRDTRKPSTARTSGNERARTPIRRLDTSAGGNG